jgi:hypothetical protein
LDLLLGGCGGGGGGVKTFSAALAAMAPTTGGMSHTKGKGIIFPPGRNCFFFYDHVNKSVI